MKRFTIACTILAVAFSTLVALSSLRQPETLPLLLADEGGASISDFMLVVHRGKTSVVGQTQADLKEPGPANNKAWAVIQARATIVAGLIDSVLAKQTPEKGEKSSWDEQVAIHRDQFKKLAAAAGKKDLAAATAELKTIKRSCGKCHKPHK
tara:strand:- start:111 stop:566 length:456 start_codon:yes stop_codon:yes gene_type:complete